MTAITQQQHPALWLAPHITRPIVATVPMPGSKSVTNRALILAALASEPSVLYGGLRSRDTNLMIEALTALGIQLVENGDAWHISPAPLGTGSQNHTEVAINCGLAGTVMRFVPPLAALRIGDTIFDGDPQARKRPMDSLLVALRELGTELNDQGKGKLPFTIRGHGHLGGGRVAINASGSSQFVSALLLAAPRFDQGIAIDHVGEVLPSLPHIAMTVAMLREVGVAIDDREPNKWRVLPGLIAGHEYRIEPDLSNAAPFLAAAAVTAGSVTVPYWPKQTTQPGDALRWLFTELGASVAEDESGLTVTGSGQLHGIDADLGDVGELTPVIAALCVLADSPSHLRGIAHLRGHETDRLAALAHELTGLGGRVRQTNDGLVIEPASLHGGIFGTYHDHRMAQAGAVLGLRVAGIEVENIATTGKTLPDFVGMWHRMLGLEPTTGKQLEVAH